MIFTNECIHIGDYYIARTDGGKLWIGHWRGPAEGEGGVFDEALLTEAIRKVYGENF